LLIAVKLADFIVTPLGSIDRDTAFLRQPWWAESWGKGRRQKITFAYCEVYRIAAAQTAPPARDETPAMKITVSHLVISQPLRMRASIVWLLGWLPNI
jgi:hypothetical protein